MRIHGAWEANIFRSTPRPRVGKQVVHIQENSQQLSLSFPLDPTSLSDSCRNITEMEESSFYTEPIASISWNDRLHPSKESSNPRQKSPPHCFVQIYRQVHIVRWGHAFCMQRMVSLTLCSPTMAPEKLGPFKCQTNNYCNLLSLLPFVGFDHFHVLAQPRKNLHKPQQTKTKLPSKLSGSCPRIFAEESAKPGTTNMISSMGPSSFIIASLKTARWASWPRSHGYIRKVKGQVRWKISTAPGVTIFWSHCNPSYYVIPISRDAPDILALDLCQLASDFLRHLVLPTSHPFQSVSNLPEIPERKLRLMKKITLRHSVANLSQAFRSIASMSM